MVCYTLPIRIGRGPRQNCSDSFESPIHTVPRFKQRDYGHVTVMPDIWAA